MTTDPASTDTATGSELFVRTGRCLCSCGELTSPTPYEPDGDGTDKVRFRFACAKWDLDGRERKSIGAFLDARQGTLGEDKGESGLRTLKNPNALTCGSRNCCIGLLRGGVARLNPGLRDLKERREGQRWFGKRVGLVLACWLRLTSGTVRKRRLKGRRK